jgi:predicted nucleic acid-binding protein
LFLDLTRNRRNEFSRALFQDIRKGKYDVVTSTFTLLEIVQEEQERTFAERELIHNKRSFDEIRIKIHERDLSSSALEDVYDSVWKDLKPFIETEKIGVRYLDEEGWDIAFELQKKMNISASDAIHLAVASIETCNIFVTSDQQLQKMGSMFFKPSELIFSSPSELEKKVATFEEQAKKTKYKTKEKT